MKIYDYITIPNMIRLILPGLVGYSFQLIPKCVIKKDSGSFVSFRPPAYVFGVVWTILYLFLGLAWIVTYHNNDNMNNLLKDLVYLLLTITLSSWIIFYACLSNKVWGIYSLFATICIIIITYIISPKISQLLLAPLLTWILLATFLNIFEVENSKKK